MKLIAAILLICTPLVVAEPFMEKQDLFVVGDNPAYKVYHIPGIVVTAKGAEFGENAKARFQRTGEW